ncbi:MAG: hypothetical protein ACRDYZ_09720 [Acidimicrobiales bacterium]
MPDADGRPAVAVLSSAWGRRDAESSFVDRVLAGGLSRLAAVDVFVPGPEGPSRPDGAFDLIPVGVSPSPLDPWPPASTACLPPTRRYDLAVVDRLTAGARALVAALFPDVPAVATLTAGSTSVPDHATALLDVGMVGPTRDLTPDDAIPVHQIGGHVAVNPLAGARRHSGIGFVDYLLVLTDRHGRANQVEPPPLARWVIARFTRHVVVVVEDAVASVWRSRSLLGRITVDSRTDLWRLLAHAAVTVDLAPGPFLAREGVESLRFGVPIVVPAGTSGHRLAAAGGGLWYDDVAELLGCIETLADPDIRTGLGQQGKVAADNWYGDPAAFVDRLRGAVTTLSGAGA